ncbi:Os10g0538600 [Oryza sativa Japonica Group]|uniref:Os10g0538600 protein n=1 Tax=Oryza sativa subsp. japonica TaxID=39947 RepID=A0A0P0XWS7_ORYSJ|nr:hypothetical protein EE612_052507 [Oryza sativa]BAT11843.1 Os10g0538600 [Oryza sativa Japonica Group]
MNGAVEVLSPPASLAEEPRNSRLLFPVPRGERQYENLVSFICATSDRGVLPSPMKPEVPSMVSMSLATTHPKARLAVAVPMANVSVPTMPKVVCRSNLMFVVLS